MKIEKIFKSEEKKSLDEIKEIRKTKGKELFNDFLEFCEKSDALPKSLTGKAVSYVINQKENLKRYLEDERLELTNNRAERAVKPFVIGRKNWLFSNTTQGADSSARIYSMIETAKMNNLNVYSYLVWLFENIHILNLEQLLPWSNEIPNEIKKTEDA